MIDISVVSKSFGALDVLRDVSLSIRPGRVTAIVGPNSAGKTTLIKAMLGLVRPDRGTITFDGVSTRGNDAYHARIGYMPQIARFPENLSGAELIAMLKDLRGGTVRTDDELIEQLGLAPHLQKPLRVLSGGTRQKVNAVLAFLFAPELFILDEPTAGLDPLSSSILKDKISAARANGKTFIVTSHIMSELEALADDVVFLLDGQVQFAGSIDALKEATHQTTLERAIGVMMLQGRIGAAA